MLTLDISFIVLLSIFVFFAGFRWGKSRRMIEAANQHYALVRRAEDEQERRELEHIEAEEARWHEWMQRYEWDKEEREARKQAEEEKRQHERLENEKAFWALFPSATQTTNAQ